MIIKWWHRLIYQFLFWCIGPILRLAWGYKCLVMRHVPAPAIIISNHTTDLDPALVGMSFPKHMAYVASEHVSRMGFSSVLLRFCFSIIGRVKGRTDAKSSKQILRTLRAGGNICLFAEGNRSFSGLTGPVFPATGKLVKQSGATLVTYKLRGGYFRQPRWGSGFRKGPMFGTPVTVYTPQQLAGMSAEAINQAIQSDINEDAYARQERLPQPYRGKALAEYIETALYLCPGCGALGSLHSHGDTFECACGLKGTYDEYGRLVGENLRFNNLRDWDDWQAGEVERLVREAEGGLICSDEGEELYTLGAGSKGVLAGGGPLRLTATHLNCGQHHFPLESIADLAITGRQTMAFSTGDGQSWELRNPAPRNALKYKRAYDILRRNRLKKPASPA